MNKLNLVFFVHPPFLGSQSMPRYATMLTEGMKSRGHNVTILSPNPVFFKINFFKPLKKWLGYIDQYIIFPFKVKNFVKNCNNNTIFVFTDHALGIWIPLVKDRLVIVHCHDFLAQLSATGKIPENSTSWSGKIYQSLIRNGFGKAKYFITVSENTKYDLHKFLTNPFQVEVIYNALNKKISSIDPSDLKLLEKKNNRDLSTGYILHVGGNQWYKNRKGVIEIYNCWRNISNKSLPLLLIGAKPNDTLLKTCENSVFKKDIYFLIDVSDELLNVAYSGATLLLYPSIKEGFGWPVAEAMACGCPVVTTGEAPMTEVGGNAAFYIPKRKFTGYEASWDWAMESAKVVDRVIELNIEKRAAIIKAGLENVKRFDQQEMLDLIEANYYKTLHEKQQDSKITFTKGSIKKTYPASV